VSVYAAFGGQKARTTAGLASNKEEHNDALHNRQRGGFQADPVAVVPPLLRRQFERPHDGELIAFLGS
jgi:hypothetical protein